MDIYRIHAGNNWEHVKEKFLSLAGSYNTTAAVILISAAVIITVKKNPDRKKKSV